jgi:ribosomal protein L21E
MDVQAATALATSLMQQHGMTALGWKFQITGAQNRLGLCTYETKTISLGVAHTLSADEAEVRNTILHEIAHALVGHRPRNAYGQLETGHGPTWKRKAIAIGCTGERTGTNNAAKALDDALIIAARAAAEKVAHITSGPLQTGERVLTKGSGRVVRGIVLQHKRTRTEIVEDGTDTVWAISGSLLFRANAATSASSTAPALPAYSPSANAGLRRGSPAIIDFPKKPKYHGLIGRIEKVNPATFKFVGINGEVVTGAKSDFRPYNGETILPALAAPQPYAKRFQPDSDVVIHHPGNRFHGTKGKVEKVNPTRYAIRTTDGGIVNAPHRLVFAA